MAVANDVTPWVRRHRPSPCHEAHRDHFSHVGGSAVSRFFPSRPGLRGPGTGRPAHHPGGPGPRPERHARDRPARMPTAPVGHWDGTYCAI